MSERKLKYRRAIVRRSAAGDERSWPYLVGGSAFFLAGVRSGFLRGLLLAGVGTAVAYRGVTGRWPVVGRQPSDPTMHVTMTINKPAEELYDLWRDLENLPALIPHVENVAAHGNKSRWEASTAIGGKLRWDAEITHEDRPVRIEWKTADGSPLPMTGRVEFRETVDGRGTEVRVDVTPLPPGGKLGASLAGALAKLPEQQLRKDLKVFKQGLEAGEISTTEGQPRGGNAAATDEGTL